MCQIIKHVNIVYVNMYIVCNKLINIISNKLIITYNLVDMIYKQLSR